MKAETGIRKGGRTEGRWRETEWVGERMQGEQGGHREGVQSQERGGQSWGSDTEK